jgi:putative glutamine amidotransferase
MPRRCRGLIVVAVTDTMRPLPVFERYVRWLDRDGGGLQVKKLSHLLDNRSELESCDGLILTGGGDVHPRYYNRADTIADVEEVNEQRDEFEFAVIDDALHLGIPILGICRGLQVFNVARGGSLVTDIEQAGYPSHRNGEYRERQHRINVSEGTLLRTMVGVSNGEVNTVHHQAADRIGFGLRVSARSEDGVIEALEWEDADRAFLMLVQWHPESMTDFGSPFSANIRKQFVAAALNSATIRKAYK